MRIRDVMLGKEAEMMLDRWKSRLGNVYGVDNLNEWISKYTMLNDKPFSFKDHEFQLDILRDSALRQVVVKCAQIGLSETMYRWAVAACCALENFTVIYTFPSATDAETQNKMRIGPMIASSPEVLALVDPGMNNSEAKKFGKNSFLLFRGTKSDTQGLSTPADAIIHDEFDKSDITKASVFESRLQHKPHKIRKIFSTPTIEKFGVSKEAETARRYRQFATCNKCNHKFAPDYYQHVSVPGWDKGLNEITRTNLHTVKWASAVLLCPKCKRDPELHHSRMEFVCENPYENHIANAWFLTPFSVPNVITVSDLIKSSTIYEKESEFKNQALGLTAEDANEAITEADMVEAQQYRGLESSEMHQMGVDMGQICTISVGRATEAGELLTVHREQCSFVELERRILELSIKYKVNVTVADYQPLTDLTRQLVNTRPNTWGAQFVVTRDPIPYRPVQIEEDESAAKVQMRLVKINKNLVMDQILALIKKKKFFVNGSDVNEDFSAQMRSHKRVQKFGTDGELRYVWVKTDGNDHYHMSTLYLHIATQMRGTVRLPGAAAAGLSLVRAVRLKAS